MRKLHISNIPWHRINIYSPKKQMRAKHGTIIHNQENPAGRKWSPAALCPAARACGGIIWGLEGWVVLPWQPGTDTAPLSKAVPTSIDVPGSSILNILRFPLPLRSSTPTPHTASYDDFLVASRQELLSSLGTGNHLATLVPISHAHNPAHCQSPLARNSI